MKIIMTPESLNHQGYIDTETEVGKIYLLFCAGASRPWHLVGMGTYHESPEAALKYLQTPQKPRQTDSGVFYSGFGQNTHAIYWD